MDPKPRDGLGAAQGGAAHGHGHHHDHGHHDHGHDDHGHAHGAGQVHRAAHAGGIDRATVFASFVNYTTMPGDLKDFVTRFELSPIVVILAICVIYIILGCAMEALSMILLTVPIFFPVIVALGYDPIWFGVLVVCVVEIGLITPPVGMNVFVLRSVLPEVPTNTMWRGVMPFVAADIVRIGVLIAFPLITLWLPRTLGL